MCAAMKRVWLLLPLVLATCAAPRPEAKLIHNGRIYLGEVHGGGSAWPSVEALLVRDGKVQAAGALAELERLAAGCERVDLRGGVALPGLQDAHGHFEALGAALEAVDLRGCASYGELVGRVRARAAELPEGTWIEGRGWDQNLWSPPEFPHHAELSAATPDHPAILQRVDGHALLANAKAMRLALAHDPRASESVGAGGRVLLDAEGSPTGVFIDAACELVQRVLPPPTREVRERRFLLAQSQLLALGLTAIHDMGIDREGIAILHALYERGELRVRTIAYLSGSATLDATSVRGLPFGTGEDQLLSVVGVKLYADGALGSRGAALLEPYHDDPSHSGLLLLDREALERAVAVCARAGLQPAVHAIGDRANRMVLDAFERQGAIERDFRSLRPRVEHAQVVAREDWERFEALGAIASMQPTHATSDMPWAPARLGPERIVGAYAWRRLASDPARLAFGSDFPVESPDPRLGLYAAVTCARADGTPSGGFLPEQRLTPTEAFAAFTLGAARAARQDDRRGLLLPGYAADLTVFAEDPLAIDPQAWLALPVRLTIVNGTIAYIAP
ncbi:MAG: amidohydrolase [Planctomycetes bacterium]|nr:amidohydrolase [Planctomycetota bacterium]